MQSEPYFDEYIPREHMRERADLDVDAATAERLLREDRAWLRELHDPEDWR